MNENWVYVGSSDKTFYIWYDEYENVEGTLCKQVWNDGYEEIFVIEK